MTSPLSTLQFLVSPRIGALSDKYGRKKILLLTMAGNILSALMYVPKFSLKFSETALKFNRQMDQVHYIRNIHAFPCRWWTQRGKRTTSDVSSLSFL